MKTIVQVIPYPAFPPRSGGALRCANILLQLARFHQTRAILFQSSQSLGSNAMEYSQNLQLYFAEGFGNSPTRFQRFPKLEGLRYRWLRKSFKGPSNSIVGRSYAALRQIFNEHHVDAVVLEHLETVSLAPVIRRLSPRSRIILDAHNVDHLLYKQENAAEMAGDSRTAASLIRRYRDLETAESNLSDSVDTFWACSDYDRCTLQRLNNGLAGFTVPNGVDSSSMPFRGIVDRDSTSPSILFCGSLGYQANRDGLNWFVAECWPYIKAKLPNIRLCVVGKGGDPSHFRELFADSSIDFIGEVESVLPYYEKSTISICPLRIGSGTRLKILEALSVGTPTVTTAVGCEGLDLVDGSHVLLGSDAADFARQCVRLLGDHDLASKLARNGRELVEAKFDWQSIGSTISKSIQSICSLPPLAV